MGDLWLRTRPGWVRAEAVTGVKVVRDRGSGWSLGVTVLGGGASEGTWDEHGGELRAGWELLVRSTHGDGRQGDEAAAVIARLLAHYREEVGALVVTYDPKGGRGVDVTFEDWLEGDGGR